VNTVLLTAGVVALMAAVIGGGLKGFNIEIPVLSSRGVRVALGALGIAFIVGAVLLRDDDGGGGGDSTEARYQRQVVATCNEVRALQGRNPRGTPELGPGGITYNRDVFVANATANIAAIERRFDLLLPKPVPDSLREEADVVRGRKNESINASRAILKQLAASLPPHFTEPELETAGAQFQDRSDESLARLEDALTELAGRECRISRS
jgi:hypothetical protein